MTTKSNGTKEIKRSVKRKRLDEVRNENYEVKALKEIVHELKREITELTSKVKVLTEENREMKAWSRAIAAKISITNEEEDAERIWDTGKRYE